MDAGRKFQCIALLMAAGVLLPAGRSLAVDGYAIGIHYELEKGKLGNIHDASAPGRLMRYDIRNGRPVGREVLYDKNGGATNACIGPFGRRIAFCKPNGMISVISAKGGEGADLVSFVGDEKVVGPVSTGLQWPASQGGRWIYYLDGRNGNNVLRRVHVATKKDELVVRFNRSARGSFGLTPDATPTTGKFVKRTDNYVIAIYDMSRGDGDLYNCLQGGGCGESVSPDGALWTANDGRHTGVTLVDMTGRKQNGFRLSQWDGDPTAGIQDREKIEWAWQYCRWSVNSMRWIITTQGKLRQGSTHEIYFADAMLYDWVNHKQINVTKNEPGRFDRAGGFWETGVGETFLGYFRGEAPLTVELKDARIEGDCTWDFGDGSPAQKGPDARHTFEKGGVFTVTAKRGGKTFHAQVNVQPRRPPVAICHYVNARCLTVDFSEPVRADEVRIRLDGGAKVAKWELNAAGLRMTIHLADPLKGDDKLHLKGIHDLAQVPNALADKPLDVTVPAWPTDRTGLVFLWEDARTLNAAFSERHKTVSQFHVSPDRGMAGLDRYGRMRLRGGRLNTGFFSQGGAQMDFGPLVEADAFTLEATIQPTDLTQSKPEFPARIVNCSAWYNWDWEFMLGQQKDRLLFSIRTTDNFLNEEGQRVEGGLHGRAPSVEIARLTDTKPRHVVISYVPGRLTAYIDGKRVLETDQVTGSLLWGYGELCFGNNHNGGRYGWLGSLEGVAIYKRFFEADEARRNYEAYMPKVRSRKVLSQIEVEASLLAMSEIPDPAKIAPYREALVVNEYEVRKVLRTAGEWKFETDIKPGVTFRAAEWGLINKRKTDLTRAKVGDVRRLVLEVYDNHPDRLDQVVTSNSLEMGLEVPLLYAPEP